MRWLLKRLPIVRCLLESILTPLESSARSNQLPQFPAAWRSAPRLHAVPCLVCAAVVSARATLRPNALPQSTSSSENTPSSGMSHRSYSPRGAAAASTRKFEPYLLTRILTSSFLCRCMYDIRDHVQVLFYDDPLFDRISDQTPACNELRTCLCGGRGEKIQIDSPCCFGCFHRATFSSIPCICVPQWCPAWIPCPHKYVIHVANAQKGIYEINKVRNAAKAGHSSVTDEEQTTKLV